MHGLVKIDFEEEETVEGTRRSKNDKEGRDHVCADCGKTYLWHASLYTHMRSKHGYATFHTLSKQLNPPA